MNTASKLLLLIEINLLNNEFEYHMHVWLHLPIQNGDNNLEKDV